ncbi:MAG: hypothetical protein IMF19_07380 [Proteobacteria bacterium]|nr:hypothetical protein [Pseudomonadota bacterium]
MGRIFHTEGDYKETLKCYLYAFALFDKLNSPNKGLVGQYILKLKEEICDALCDRYYEEIKANE